MDFDVFISHSSKDKITANATCAALEAAGIRSWIAPRDVNPGSEYAASIVDAIDSCRVMVVLVSSSANESRQIHREIERAASRGVPIVPMRIEEIVPTKSMAYFLGEIHWLDALTPPLAEHLQKLVDTIRAVLQVKDGADLEAAGGGARRSAAFTPIAPPGLAKQANKPTPSTAGPKTTMSALASIAALIGLACVVAFVIWQQPPSPAPQPPTPQSQQPPSPPASGQTNASGPQPSPGPTTADQAPPAPKPAPAPIVVEPAPSPIPKPTSPPATVEPALPPSPAFTVRKTAAFGGSGGAAFDDIADNQGRRPISAITVMENLNPADTKQRIVGSLQVRWNDQSGSLHGGKGPYAQPAQAAALAPNEKIGRVDINWKSYHFPTSNGAPPQWVAGLAIWTDARVYSFGDMTFGPTNQCILAYGEVLLGFHGRSGSYIDQIGCVIGVPK